MTKGSSLESDNLRQLAERVGNDWKQAADYYAAAENDMDARWASIIWPMIEDCDFTTCLDLAAGHGRNTRKLLEQGACRRIFVVDINQENIDFCTRRFMKEPRVTCIRNDGIKLDFVEPDSISLFYIFDAMVHFDSDVVRSYLSEISRVLQPGTGRAFLHHSNFTGNPGGNVHDNPHWRNFMSAELLVHYCTKEGLAVERQLKLDWNYDGSYIDCVSLVSRAA